ncbi:hypothetical protein GOP47_0010715 [Adiantum capillus-veneris]|uniref:Uncharacterized protein n=1 Tax=Adiantum capillus-veneris TaxID=13818 RepID=A0A9D4ZGN4_ADICA|nr:hypothetical protein GOP47_0010715 [Adiantum capillus-veneris]
MAASKEELKKEAVLLVHRQGADAYSAMQALVGGQPYLKRAADGLLAIRVENPANVEKIADGYACQGNMYGGGDGPLQLKEKGNAFFASQDWSKAIQYYGECIIRIVQEGKEKGENQSLLLAAYSNRAEARMKLGLYEEALIDCDAALSIDPDHLKSKYRKGRALHGMTRFQDASACLEELLSRHPELSEIRAFLDTMKSANIASEMIKGLSDFVLNRKIIPKFSDYVGPVVVRQTEDGRGRGLFATAKVRPGELLLASNALAFAVHDVRRSPVHNAFATEKIAELMQEDLVSELVKKGKDSSVLLRQVFNLASSGDAASMEVPSMDTFMKNARASETVNALEVDIALIMKIVKSNGFNQEP